jgi:hypothetical protein
MAGKGVLFALDGDEERQLLAFSDARRRAAWVANTIEERWDEAWLCAVGETWLPIHFCLHGSAAAPIEGAPAEAKAVLGGVPLGVPKLYGIDYKDSELVRRIASALSRIRDDAVWARAGLVERKDYTGPRSADLQVDVVDGIHALADFYRRASDDSRAVIFTVNE